MDEVTEITEFIQEEAGQNAEIIWGNGLDESLGNKISITLVATGFHSDEKFEDVKPSARKVHELTVGPKEDIKKPVSRVTQPITEITLIKHENSEVEDTEENNEEPKSFTKENKEVVNTIELIPRKEPVIEKKPEISKRPGLSFEPSHSNEENGRIEIDEIEKKSKERIKKLKDLSIKLRSPQEIDHMESTPAYIRRQVELSDVKPSSESEVSRFTLGDGEDSKGDLKTNNSFLHDNVD